jgi:hypothetical protein
MHVQTTETEDVALSKTKEKTGMHCGEALVLTWDSIDFQADAILSAEISSAQVPTMCTIASSVFSAFINRLMFSPAPAK